MSDIEIKSPCVLSEVIGSKYTKPGDSYKLKEFFDRCVEYKNSKGSKVCVDLKGIKLNSQVHGIFYEYMDSIEFMDTENPIINDILIHNSMVSKFQDLEVRGILKTKLIPLDLNPTEIYNYIQDLDTTTIYKLPGFRECKGQSPDVGILISMAIMYLYPEVSVDLSEQSNNFFKMFRQFWFYTGRVKRDAYNLLWYGTPMKVSATRKDNEGNNYFYVPGVGELREDILNSNYTVIPYDFGSSSNLTGDIELEGIYDKVCERLYKVLAKRKKKKLIQTLS